MMSTYDEGKESKSSSPVKKVIAKQPSFINHGLDNWSETRREWMREKLTNSGSGSSKRTEVCAKNVDNDEIIENIFAQQGSAGDLPIPVPLGQMIDILIDFWEADGLYD